MHFSCMDVFPMILQITHFIVLAKPTKAEIVHELLPIALLNILYKVYGKLLNTRARKTLDIHQLSSQADLKNLNSM